MYKHRYIAVILVVFSLLIGIFSCKRSGKKVISRFKDGTTLVLHEYPDLHDTSTYTYWEYYPDGKIHQRISVENNSIIGTPTTYYISGKVYTLDSLYHPRSRYSESWDGIIKRYNEDGILIAQFEVKNGTIQGLAKMFNSQGILLKEYYLIKDSIKNGAYTEFYPNGSISVKANFTDGMLNGMMYYFDKKGDTSKYYMCNKGDIIMPYKKWLDNGTVLYGDYANKDEKVVIWKWYSKDKTLIKKESRRLKDGGFAAPE